MRKRKSNARNVQETKSRRRGPQVGEAEEVVRSAGEASSGATVPSSSCAGVGVGVAADVGVGVGTWALISYQIARMAETRERNARPCMALSPAHSSASASGVLYGNAEYSREMVGEMRKTNSKVTSHKGCIIAKIEFG
jgi:hypothetical protein